MLKKIFFPNNWADLIFLCQILIFLCQMTAFYVGCQLLRYHKLIGCNYRILTIYKKESVTCDTSKNDSPLNIQQCSGKNVIRPALQAQTICSFKQLKTKFFYNVVPEQLSQCKISFHQNTKFFIGFHLNYLKVRLSFHILLV